MAKALRRASKPEPTNTDLQQAILENMEAIQQVGDITKQNSRAIQQVWEVTQQNAEAIQYLKNQNNGIIERLDNFIVLKERHDAEIVALRDSHHRLDKRLTRVEAKIR